MPTCSYHKYCIRYKIAICEQNLILLSVNTAKAM